MRTVSSPIVLTRFSVRKSDISRLAYVARALCLHHSLAQYPLLALVVWLAPSHAGQHQWQIAVVSTSARESSVLATVPLSSSVQLNEGWIRSAVLRHIVVCLDEQLADWGDARYDEDDPHFGATTG
jgi:hypothetical protein